MEKTKTHMTWLSVALLGYFFSALGAVFDKYILSGPIKAPAVYAFFVGLFSLVTVIFVPFGFQFVGVYFTLTFLLSGVLYLFGVLYLYKAIKGREISRVAPISGTVTSVVALCAAFLLEPATGLWYFLSLALLIGGGLLLVFDLPLRKNDHLSSDVVISGILIGISLLLLKYGYSHAGFVSGLIWSRLGLLLAGFSLLIPKRTRHEILSEVHAFSTGSKKRAAHTGGVFLLSKTSAGIASFLIIYATSLGPISFVQALSGFQYLFILLLALPLTFWFPKIFGERLTFWDWFQKVCAIIFIGIGLWLAATHGASPLII